MTQLQWLRWGTAPAGLIGGAVYAAYRRSISRARMRLRNASKVIDTWAGPVEYAEEGTGEPVLSIHGAGGGFDQGLLVGRELPQGYRLIAPSRFGYLRTPIPQDSSIEAQADAHDALLMALQVGEAIVVGVSAGAPSAIELALKHPQRVKALILLVPRTYDPTSSMGVDQAMPSRLVMRMIEGSADFAFWISLRVARKAIVRFLGVPPEVEANARNEDRDRVSAIIRSVLPLSDRVAGIKLDNSHRLAPWPLDQLQVPTLVVSAKDDLFHTLPGAEFTARQIPGAELKVLESGGHLMVGQGNQVRAWISDFLHRRVAGAGGARPAGGTHSARPIAA